MKYRLRPCRPEDFSAILAFIRSAQIGADRPWNWFIDRLNFTYSVSCAMHGTSPEEWARRAALLYDETDRVVAVVITEGENRGEAFFLTRREDLPETALRELFAFAQANSATPDDDGRRRLHLRIDPSFPLRERLAAAYGFRRIEWAEQLSVLDLRGYPELPVPDGFVLLDAASANGASPNAVSPDAASPDAASGGADPSGADPSGDSARRFIDAKTVCHSRSFGYVDDAEFVERIRVGFGRLAAMPDYRPELDLLLMDAAGTPAAMMGFWYDETSRWGIIEPAGTVPERQRMGLGRFLIAEGGRRLRALGAERLWVGTDKAFYLACGFRVANRWNVWEWKEP